uniref:Uncharacterized protein n=1 Tax=Meleagris gallopavo TaxID=9103 RepID=A0A803XTS7_MELGA
MLCVCVSANRGQSGATTNGGNVSRGGDSTSSCPQGEMRLPLRPLPVPAAVSLSPAAAASWHQWRWPSSWLEDAGTYQCRYQVSEPLWTSNKSEPVELVLTGAKGRSHGSLVVAVVRGCAAVFVFSLGLYFVLDARSLWTSRDRSPGVTPETPKSMQFQVTPRDSEDLTYTEMPAAIPCSQTPSSHTDPQPPVIYTTVSTELPC